MTKKNNRDEESQVLISTQTEYAFTHTEIIIPEITVLLVPPPPSSPCRCQWPLER